MAQSQRTNQMIEPPMHETDPVGALLNQADAVVVPVLEQRESKAPNNINWRLYRTERLRPLWQVVALSFSLPPFKPSLEAAFEDETFSESFEERRRYLGRKLQSVRQKDYVTYFPFHPHASRRSRSASSFIVDVLDCIVALKLGYDDLPEEFLAMSQSLTEILPPAPSSYSGIVPVASDIDDAALYLEQDGGSRIQLDEQGRILLRLPLQDRKPRGHGFGGSIAIIEETVLRQLSAGIAYAAWLLERIDATQKLTHVAIATRIDASEHLG